jgi:cytidyltransferase-like protein
MTYEVGVIHGRFQPLHFGHLEYLLAGADRCDLLIVGITNPDPSQVVQEETDTARGMAEANPCTYYERYVMVERALTEAGVARERLRIVPFPHGHPQRLRYYAPADAVYLMTIYDGWGLSKLDRFHALGLRTDVMWKRDDKPISGSLVRSQIAAGHDWHNLVPPAVARTIKEFGIDERIRA